jgi:hypothetical protein
MLVTERMQALGDHARSSRQPPLKERKRAKADESAAEGDVLVIDEPQIEPALENAPAAVVDEFSVQADDVSTQIIAHENGNDGSVAEITSNEDASATAMAAPVAAEVEPQPAPAADSATQARAIQEHADLSAAKRAIIHEWENWSALHSDELDDPNVVEYFFRHLQEKRPQLLNFSSQDKLATVRRVLGAP